MHAYIDIKTGEKHYLCPDPLCSHKAEEGCLFVDIFQFYISNNRLYTTRRINNGINPYPVETIIEIDLEQNTVRELFQCDSEYDYIGFTSLEDNKIYFTYTKETLRTEDENGDIVTEDELTKMYLDLDTEKVYINEANSYTYETYSLLYKNNNDIYGIDQINNRIIMTDSDYKNEEVIFDYDEWYSIADAYFDKNTEELYFCLASINIIDAHMDYTDAEEGAIYVIDKENNVRKLEMPTEKITSFRLTKNYIYYTTYDPINFGMSVRGYDCVVEDSGKIYRVSRDDTTSPELVFDAKGEMFFESYIVMGDYLYIRYIEFINQVGAVYFRATYSTARIHMEDQTIKWLNFD